MFIDYVQTFIEFDITTIRPDSILLEIVETNNKLQSDGFIDLGNYGQPDVFYKLTNPHKNNPSRFDIIIQYHGSFFPGELNKDVELFFEVNKMFHDQYEIYTVSRVDLAYNLPGYVKDYKYFSAKPPVSHRKNPIDHDQITANYFNSGNDKYEIKVYDKEFDPNKTHDLIRFGTTEFARYEIKLKRKLIKEYAEFDMSILTNNPYGFLQGVLNIWEKYNRFVMITKNDEEIVLDHKLEFETFNTPNLEADMIFLGLKKEKVEVISQYEMQVKTVAGHINNRSKNIIDVRNIILLLKPRAISLWAEYLPIYASLLTEKGKLSEPGSKVYQANLFNEYVIGEDDAVREDNQLINKVLIDSLFSEMDEENLKVFAERLRHRNMINKERKKTSRKLNEEQPKHGGKNESNN